MIYLYNLLNVEFIGTYNIFKYKKALKKYINGIQYSDIFKRGNYRFGTNGYIKLGKVDLYFFFKKVTGSYGVAVDSSKSKQCFYPNSK